VRRVRDFGAQQDKKRTKLRLPPRLDCYSPAKAAQTHASPKDTSMASGPKSEYKRGTMDIREQQATFSLFWSLTKWGTVLTVLLMVFLAFMFT